MHLGEFLLVGLEEFFEELWVFLWLFFGWFGVGGFVGFELLELVFEFFELCSFLGVAVHRLRVLIDGLN